MAISTGTMTITITESLDVGTTVMDTATSVSETITVNDIFKRVITCPTSEITLYSTHESNVAGATFDKDLVKYVRITNYDSSNWCAIRITDANSDEAIFKLEAGKSFLLWGHAGSGGDGMMSAEKAGNAGSAPDAAISSVEAQANSSAVDLEIVIAS